MAYSILIFGVLIGVVGFFTFDYAFRKEYDASTYSMAVGARALIDGDKIAGSSDGHDILDPAGKGLLNEYCNNMDLSHINLFAVDENGNDGYRSVMAIDNESADTGLTEPEPDRTADTLSDDHIQKMQAICENGSDQESIYSLNVFGKSDIEVLIPVKNGTGQVTGILSVKRSAGTLTDATMYYIISTTVAGIVTAIVILLITTRSVRKQFIEPVEKTSAEAVRFTKEYKIDKPLGDISRIDEFADLARSIDTLETEVTNYIDVIATSAAEEERLKTELDMASKIQDSQIPKTFPAFPDRKEFDIYGSMTPARLIGGDFYNYLLIDDDHLAMWIGDVSGKSIPAALFMMSANMMLSARVRFKGSPAEILEDVNNRICENNEAGMFVTVWLGILELSSGVIAAANAGHVRPAVCQDNLFERIKDKHGMPLGGINNSKYKDYTIKLVPGDKVFVYSDGIPEARNNRQEMFQPDRMIDSLNRNRDRSAEEIVQALKADIDEFVGDTQQFDDLTMLLFEYKG